MSSPELRWRDAVVPACVALLAVVELAGLDATGRLPAAVVLVLACAALVVRRRWPIPSATAAGVLCAVAPWFGPKIDDVATPILILAIATYSLGRWVAGYLGLVGVALVLASLVGDYLTVDDRSHDITDVVFILVLLLPPYVFGRVTRRLADYGEVLEHEQELVRRAAARDERDRIARELHDVIAHSVSAMVVQVAVAQDLVRRDPDRAMEVLDAAAGTGRRALAETGRLLHVIRDSADELGLAPAPGLADLPALVEDFRSRGLRVEVTGGPDLAPLPAGVDVSAYRIVSEALTNASRYASDGAVELDVRTDGSGVAIRAENASSGAGGQGSGLGLAGMTERVHLLGGTMSTSNTAGRFVLEVRLPLTVGEAAEAPA